MIIFGFEYSAVHIWGELTLQFKKGDFVLIVSRIGVSFNGTLSLPTYNSQDDFMSLMKVVYWLFYSMEIGEELYKIEEYISEWEDKSDATKKD